MTPADIAIKLLPAALQLLPQLLDAINAGNQRRARDLAEEMARRQAFELRQLARTGEL